MTNKITKALAKFSPKERRAVKEMLLQLKEKNTDGLQIAKLKGHDDIFRVCKGQIRIIFRRLADEVVILAIERRSEKTYRDY